MMLAASMRNMAANKALARGQEIGIASRATYSEQGKKGSTWTMQNGKKTHWKVDDPLVLEALEALHFTGYDNPAMKAAGIMKRALTFGVTVSPVFRIRNLLRDTLQTSAIASDAAANPLKNLREGRKLTGRENDTMAQLMAGGGAVRFGSFNDGAQADAAKRMIAQGFKDSQILDTPQKLQDFFGKAWRWYQETGDRSETINRAAVYLNVLEKTGSHLQASFAARDLMNFTSMGSSAAVRALAQVVPFLNARLQGMDRLYRGAKQDPRRFATVAGYIGAASAFLYLLHADDEEYRALPDYVRDTYWPVKLGGVWAYIPKPFEVGALGTVVERATELMVAGSDYTIRDFKNTLFGVLGEQGAGVLAHFDLRDERLIYMGTLGKAAGLAGAFVCAHENVVNWLVQKSRPYIYTTAASPALAHAVLCSLDIIAGEDGQRRREQLASNIAYLRQHLRAVLRSHPWHLLDSGTAIQPLIIGDNAQALHVAGQLFEQGIWVPAIRPPTVPPGSARLRIALSAAHTHEDIDRLVAAIANLQAQDNQP